MTQTQEWKEKLYSGWRYDACTGIIPRLEWDLHEGDTLLDMELFIGKLLSEQAEKHKEEMREAIKDTAIIASQLGRGSNGEAYMEDYAIMHKVMVKYGLAEKGKAEK